MIKIYKNEVKILENNRADFKLCLFEILEDANIQSSLVLRGSDGFVSGAKDFRTARLLAEIEKLTDFRVEIS